MAGAFFHHQVNIGSLRVKLVREGDSALVPNVIARAIYSWWTKERGANFADDCDAVSVTFIGCMQPVDLIDTLSYEYFCAKDVDEMVLNDPSWNTDQGV
jgi:hypothetical protein